MQSLCRDGLARRPRVAAPRRPLREPGGAELLLAHPRRRGAGMVLEEGAQVLQLGLQPLVERLLRAGALERRLQPLLLALQLQLRDPARLLLSLPPRL